jgi:hypothetical protein
MTRKLDRARVVARCGSCKQVFSAQFVNTVRLPPRCPLCFGPGTFWVDEHGVPLGLGDDGRSSERMHKDSVHEARNRKAVHAIAAKGRKRLNADS